MKHVKHEILDSHFIDSSVLYLICDENSLMCSIEFQTFKENINVM